MGERYITDGKIGLREFIEDFLHITTLNVRDLGYYNKLYTIPTSKLWDFGISIRTSKKPDLYFYLNEYNGIDFKSENITAFRGFFIDYDADTPLKEIVATYKPSAIVSSGRGKHVYYLFDTPITDKNIIDKLATDIKKWNIKLHKEYGIDKKNPLTAMPRLPGSINPKNGKRVEVLYLSDTRYTPETIYDILDIKGVTLFEIEDVKVPTNIPTEIPEVNIQELDVTAEFKHWVKSITTGIGISDKFYKKDNTIDVSKVFFYTIKLAQRNLLDDITIIGICLSVPILKKQILKRGGLNKYSLGEIYRILAMPVIKEKKIKLTTKFANTTIQTLYDGSKDTNLIVDYILKQLRQFSGFKYKNTILAGAHRAYYNYDDMIVNIKHKINDIEPIENLENAGIKVNTIINKLLEEPVEIKEKVEPIVVDLALQQYKSNQYIVDEYKQLLLSTFNLPYDIIITKLKPTFYTIRKELLPSLIKKKSSRIFNLT